MTNLLQKLIIILILEGVWRTLSTFKSPRNVPHKRYCL